MIKYSPTQPKSARRFVARGALAAAGALIVALVSMDVAIGQATPPAVTAAPAAAAPAAAPGPREIVGDAQRGRTKVAACIGCHGIPGYKADFPIVYSVPMLGGQNAKYIESALKAYQKGERRFPTMIATARSLSDQDIADVAAYYAAQR